MFDVIKHNEEKSVRLTSRTREMIRVGKINGKIPFLVFFCATVKVKALARFVYIVFVSLFIEVALNTRAQRN